MAEVLVDFPEFVVSEDGRTYMARACGAEAADGLWHGWIEFLPVDGGQPIRSPRETTQPNRTDAHYWATGLTGVYLEGALHRALTAGSAPHARVPRHAIFDEPAGERGAPPRAPDAILDPFSVYQKGETLLRRQLGALSAWHLANIVRAYRLDTGREDVGRLPAADLIELIVSGVRRSA